MNELEQKIEALLFYRNEPVSFSWLAKTLDVSNDEVAKVLSLMQKEKYTNRGLNIIIADNTASLVTSKVAADIIARVSKSQSEKELSKQALETLSIILYKNRVTKSEIDYIRGVNSVFILRNLRIRGLIEKKPNLLDKRSPFYVPTHNLLSFLGITNIDELPHYDKIQKRLILLEEEFNQDKKNTEPIAVGDSESSE